MNGIKFEDFAETIKSSLSVHAGSSYVNPTITYGVSFYSIKGGEIKLPEAARKYEFDEATIVAITGELGLDQNSERHKVKTAELLAKRSSWIIFIQSKLANLHKREIQLLLGGTNSEIAIDYVTLIAGLNHPWIEEKIHQLKNEKHPDPNDFRDPEEIQRWAHRRQAIELEDPSDPIFQEHVASFEKEKENIALNKEFISYWIDTFKFDKGLWVSEFEPDAFYAELDIKSAKQIIKELQIKIKEQETIICKAQRPIRRFRLHEKNRKAGSNIRSDGADATEKKQIRKDVARKFFKMWVASLIEVLEVENSAGLAKITNINKMTWWRYSNGKTVPPYSQLSDLRGETIKSGKYGGMALENIPTYPKLEDLVSLVQLV